MTIDGKKLEKVFAKRYGLKCQPASGALKPPSLKGDCKDDDVLYDLKSTEKSQYTVTDKVMKKITSEAMGANRIPCLVINFVHHKQEYAVLRMCDFELMRDAYFKETGKS